MSRERTLSPNNRLLLQTEKKEGKKRGLEGERRKVVIRSQTRRRRKGKVGVTRRR